MRDFSLPGQRGSSPMSSVPNPKTPTVPSSSMAEIVAEANPTASGGNSRSANHQYMKPMADVKAVVPIRELEFDITTLFDFLQPRIKKIIGKTPGRE